MIFKDVEFPQDTIKATILEEKCGHFVEIDIQGDRAEGVCLTKEDARALGEHLIALSEKI